MEKKKAEAPPPGLRLDDHLGFILGRTDYLMKKWLLARMREKGYEVAGEEMVILGRLFEEDGLSQTVLSERTVKDKTTVTRLLATMQKKGLIKRKADAQDGRVQRVHITAKGRKYFENFFPEAQSFMQKLNETIPAEDLRLTTETLKRIYRIVLEEYS